jgi:hypothetical protein
VALAYGWVTIVILSMVKRAHPSYSNKGPHDKSVLDANVIQNKCKSTYRCTYDESGMGAIPNL